MFFLIFRCRDFEDFHDFAYPISSDPYSSVFFDCTQGVFFLPQSQSEGVLIRKGSPDIVIEFVCSFGVILLEISTVWPVWVPLTSSDFQFSS